MVKIIFVGGQIDPPREMVLVLTNTHGRANARVDPASALPSDSNRKSVLALAANEYAIGGTHLVRPGSRPSGVSALRCSPPRKKPD